MLSSPRSARLAFDRFELDLRSGELRKDGRKIRLQAQPFQLLALLVENTGEVVTREQVCRALWPADTFVDFDHGLAVAVNKVREALSDSADDSRFVETLPKRGYRFIAPVEQTAAPLASHGMTQSSIAVLPFANISANKENEVLGDGLAEEVINALARTSGLMVSGRTSSFFFRGKDVELSEIGRHLNVQYVLEGSVRREGNHVRVTAQLVKVADGFHLWSARYDREMTDLFAIQDEITTGIAESLRVTLSPETAAPRRRVPDLAAYDAYLKGRDHLLVRPVSGSAEIGKQLLERAIQLDPKFPLPYSLLGIYYTAQASWAAMPACDAIQLARAAEEGALRIDPSLPEAHAMMGCCAGMDYAWAQAEQHWRLAMRHQSVSHDVLFWHANHFLLPIGRVGEAIEVESKVLESDPLNLLYRHHFAVSLRHSGRLQEAEAELRKILGVDANYTLALGTLGSICAQQGRLNEALKLTEAAHAMAPIGPFAGQFAALLKRTGATSQADSLVDKLSCGEIGSAAVGLTVFHALLGQFDQAADYADQAINERYPLLIAVSRPLLGGSPQWPALAKRMNLPG
ncbi:MAG TPA: FlgO family outer membrane protein [Candidatus Acidoferrum sp.]|nr:FlgO family outer membrane protein [Candidatus Acidoferrum sp.]